MASLILDQSSGYYYAQFYSRHQKPSRKKIPLRTRRLRVAEKAQRRLEDAYVLGQFDPWASAAFEETPAVDTSVPDLSRMGDAVDAFLQSKAHLRPRTLRTYRQIVEPFADYLGRAFSVEQIKPKHVLGWLGTTKAGDVTRRKYNHHLGYLFRFLVRGGWMSADVSKQVQLRKVPEQAPKAMTMTEVQKLLDQIAGSVSPEEAVERLSADREWLYVLVSVNVRLGLRRGELVVLTRFGGHIIGLRVPVWQSSALRV